MTLAQFVYTFFIVGTWSYLCYRLGVDAGKIRKQHELSPLIGDMTVASVKAEDAIAKHKRELRTRLEATLEAKLKEANVNGTYKPGDYTRFILAVMEAITETLANSEEPVQRFVDAHVKPAKDIREKFTDFTMARAQEEAGGGYIANDCCRCCYETVHASEQPCRDCYQNSGFKSKNETAKEN